MPWLCVEPGGRETGGGGVGGGVCGSFSRSPGTMMLSGAPLAKEPSRGLSHLTGIGRAAWQWGARDRSILHGPPRKCHDQGNEVSRVFLSRQTHQTGRLGRRLPFPGAMGRRVPLILPLFSWIPTGRSQGSVVKSLCISLFICHSTPHPERTHLSHTHTDTHTLQINRLKIKTKCC